MQTTVPITTGAAPVPEVRLPAALRRTSAELFAVGRRIRKYLAVLPGGETWASLEKAALSVDWSAQRLEDEAEAIERWPVDLPKVEGS